MYDEFSPMVSDGGPVLEDTQHATAILEDYHQIRSTGKANGSIYTGSGWVPVENPFEAKVSACLTTV